MVQDLFRGEAARAKRSYVTVIFGVVPILAPALGSVLTDLFGWRFVHGALAVFGGLLLCIAWVGVAESRAPDAGPLRSGPRGIARLWDDAGFLRMAMTNALSYAVIFVYIAGSPIVIMTQMGQSSGVFSGIFACTAVALAAGAWVNGRLTRLGVGARRLVRSALLAAAAAALALAGLSLAGIVVIPFLIPVLLPVLLVVLFTRGIIAPNLQHLAMERQRERAGVASAVLGVSQLLSGAAASAVVALLLPSPGLAAVAVPMALLACAALTVWSFTRD